MSHTKGPWYQRLQGSEIEIKTGIYTICMVHNFNDQEQKNIANAKLIAAAPELLEACKSILKSMQQSANMSEAAKEHYKEAINKCKSAINKATA